VFWAGIRRPPPVAEFVPPGGCVAGHLWVSAGVASSERCDYLECVSCQARRIVDLTTEKDAAAGKPNVGWVTQGPNQPRHPVVAVAATGACSTCPYRGRCHPARQHAAAGYGEGRHYLCPVNRDFEAQERAAAPQTLFLRAIGALQRRAKRLPWPASLQIRVRR
jgi:hypothetical protein